VIRNREKARLDDSNFFQGHQICDGTVASYSDHNENIRTKGSCDYCRGTRPDFPSGFDAYGHGVPHHRKEKAFNAIREMAPEMSTAEILGLIDRLSQHIGRDAPYQAQQAALERLDLTGTYRLLATLLSG
jgi:hypothetical protein